MKKIILLLVILHFFNVSFAQETVSKDVDVELKDSIYQKNKAKVLNFSMKDFDKLFFEFTDKKFEGDLILTKKEFYNYTIQIAIFSDRLAKLYPDQKEVAAQNKKKWFAESYEDYLRSKETNR